MRPKSLAQYPPFLYVKGLNPCVPKEVTGAYPSGHAVLSKLFSLVLSDFFPGKKDQLEARAKQIGDHRILSGMHHRSDVEVGRSIAILIYEEFKKSKSFLNDFEKTKTKLSSL
ncbi:MAG: phosphatase PAP2 family protein [Oligoflexia bacterium]